MFVVESYALSRKGAQITLSTRDNIEYIGEADDAEGALSQIKALIPDIVIVASELPSVDGLNLIREIRRFSPSISTIVSASHDDNDETLLHAIQAGAAGYFSKPGKGTELVDLVERVARGEYPINEMLLNRPKVASKILRQFQDLLLVEKEVEPFISPLTPRETEILSHIVRGNANKEIAYSLKISNQTVKNHMTSILRKLAANDRTHAVVLALRHGFIRMG